LRLAGCLFEQVETAQLALPALGLT